jgi:23S rRNA pseudouridine2605 synthase
MPAERLQTLLARAGVASRRAAEQVIAAGRVQVNGTIARLGDRADPAVDQITLDGAPLADAVATVHYAVHKPAGLLSSSRDERGRRSVLSLVPVAPGARLWPAGRLDVGSEGLMLLTNDGPWANRVLHPRYGLVREYAVLVDGRPDGEALDRLVGGVTLDDGPARLLAVRRALPPPEVPGPRGEQGTWLRVEVGEGRKREVRRLFAAVGHRVRRLVRTRLGTVTLAGLAPGSWRLLREQEVEALERGAQAVTVAIDGTSGSGKSTIGHALANRIGATFVDTGLMYRALTLAALDRGIDPDDGETLGRLADEVRIEVERPADQERDRLATVLLEGRDVTHQVRTPRIDRAVSAVSRHRDVRRAMVEVQRRVARRGDTVMVGRDIGTVVLPKATLKVFLTAPVLVRAARRAAEMGRPDRAEEYVAEIERRDEADSQRELAPLRIAPGALVLDTGEHDVASCVETIVGHLPVAAARRRTED